MILGPTKIITACQETATTLATIAPPAIALTLVVPTTRLTRIVMSDIRTGRSRGAQAVAISTAFGGLADIEAMVLIMTDMSWIADNLAARGRPLF